MGKRIALSVSIFIAFACVGSHAQETNNSVFVPDQEIRVHDLPSFTAASHNLTAVLETALEISLRDKDICYRKDAALEDSLAADPRSLKELSGRIQGRHLLNDGRPVMITADFVPRTLVHPELIIGALRAQHVPLMEWKAHFYLVSGVIYNETVDNGGVTSESIHKILLIDPRYSDSRRDVVFDRETDDWEKVEGLLVPQVTR